MNRNLFDPLWEISLTQLTVLIILRTVTIGMSGFYLKLFASKFDIHLRSKEWLGLSFITTMGNQIMPLSGGMVARAVYLKHCHSLSYTEFATLLTATYLITYWIVSLVGLLTCFSLGNFGVVHWTLSAFFLAVIVVILLVVTMSSYFITNGNRIINRMAQGNRITDIIRIALRGWLIIKRDRRLLALITAITFMSVFLNGLSFWVAYQAIHINIPPQIALLISILPFFLLLINITPGNLGIQEIMISLLSGFVGRGLGEGMLVALLIRATTLIPALILGTIYSFILSLNLINRKQEFD